MVRSQLQLSEGWPCNNWSIGSSLEANLGGVVAYKSITFFFTLSLALALSVEGVPT